ncbi:MAG: epoxyqueuosine reductase [Clostridia bacterium]|nr:epoxyqueuosine reductase [Clostridia bacterium]
MREEFLKLFSDLKIEYFSALAYSDCSVTGARIMERESFTPRSVIIYLLPYYTGECVNISRYAASLDYHAAIAETNSKIAELLSRIFKGCSYRGYGDHSPIDERHAALVSGLGILGDSGLLINEKYGTYVFIGDIVTDIPPEEIGALTPGKYVGCHHCGACRAACPTGVLRGESCDCLSAITQRKGELTADEADLMRKYNTAWGCDECQSACPYNKNPKFTPIEFFYRDRIDCLSRESLDAMDKASFSARAFAWRGRAVLERNLDILAQNKDCVLGENK